jgi:prophage antirepressor-like protein
MGNSTAALVDAQGKVIVTQKLNAVSSQIDVSILPSGLYKLILYSDTKSLNFSISVIH